MTLEQIKLLDHITKEVLIQNNLHWLHTIERARHQVEEGRIQITTKDLHHIVDTLLTQNKTC